MPKARRPAKTKTPRQGKPRVLTMFGGPIALYLVLFIIVTMPLIGSFSSHLFADGRDGLVMVWGVWWTKTAIVDLNQSPWQTTNIYYPHGVNLVTHTLAPLAGFLAIGLPFLTLTQTYNFMIVLGFVGGALSAFWLAFYVTRTYWPSLVGGFVFSFCNYHFAHMPGHLNLVLVQFIPLFVLCWIVLLKSPNVRMALASSATLLMVILCDYYYFFYCCLAALIFVAWRAIQSRDAIFFCRKNYLIPFALFAVATAVSSGALIFRLWSLSRSQTFIGAHDPNEFSTDLLSPFVYGSVLRFSALTEGMWSKLPGNTSESSVYMGVSVVALLVYGWIRRRRLATKGIGIFYVLTLFYLLCSFGPKLHVMGQYINGVPMPYQLLELLFPPLEFSGAPSRMMVMAMLGAGVICAAVLRELWRGGRVARAFAVAAIVVMFVEFLPQRLDPFPAQVPAYVEELRKLPHGPVIDGGTSDVFRSMYYQTVHEKPLALGRIARIPEQVHKDTIDVLRKAERREFEALHRDSGFRYFVDPRGQIYDLSRPTR